MWVNLMINCKVCGKPIGYGFAELLRGARKVPLAPVTSESRGVGMCAKCYGGGK